jgi:O-succinylbenzoate synthase
VAFALDCLEAQLLPCQPLPVPVPLLQGDPEQLLQDWRGRSQRPGCIKLKVGRTTARQTQALVQGLLAESPELRLRLDANRAWSLSEGLDRVSSLPLSNIDYIEEPCTHWQDSVRLHRQTGVPWALDEHTRLLDVQAAGLPGLNMLVIKPTLLGGFGQCRAWIDAGRARGVAACISSSYETETGLGLLARLARMWTPGVPPGLDTAGIFAPLPSPGDALDAPRF